jgi:hypothetical protein
MASSYPAALTSPSSAMPWGLDAPAVTRPASLLHLVALGLSGVQHHGYRQQPRGIEPPARELGGGRCA